MITVSKHCIHTSVWSHTFFLGEDYFIALYCTCQYLALWVCAVELLSMNIICKSQPRWSRRLLIQASSVLPSSIEKVLHTSYSQVDLVFHLPCVHLPLTYHTYMTQGYITDYLELGSCWYKLLVFNQVHQKVATVLKSTFLLNPDQSDCTSLSSFSVLQSLAVIPGICLVMRGS